MLDERLLDFFISNAPPRNIVEQDTFRNLVLLGLPEKLTVMTRKTLNERLDSAYITMTNNLRAELSKQQHLSATADLWSKGKRYIRGCKNSFKKLLIENK